MCGAQLLTQGNSVQFGVFQDEEKVWQIVVSLENATNFFNIKNKVKANGYVFDKHHTTKTSAFEKNT